MSNGSGKEVMDYVRQYSIYGILIACAALAKWSFDTERRVSVVEERVEANRKAMIDLGITIRELQLATSQLNQTGAVISIQQQRNNEDIRRLLDVLQSKFNQDVKNKPEDAQ